MPLVQIVTRTGLGLLRATMQRALDRIFSYPKGSEYMLLPLFIVAWDQLYNIVVAQLLYSKAAIDAVTIANDRVLVASWGFPFELILGATLEELIFRIIPLALLLRFTRNRRIIIVSILALSVAFAFMHGGWPTLLLQGIGGVLYSILFIKYADNGKRLLEACAVVVLIHIIFNLLAVMISVSAGGAYF